MINELAHYSITSSCQAMSMGWEQPPENTHASLVEAMNRFDGVEFDLRLTADNQLIVHHDHRISIPIEKLEGRNKYVENWNLDDLTEIGFCSFSKLMEDKKFSIPWREHSKVACLEIKRSHPKIAKNPDNKMAEVMRQAASIIDDAGIPETNACLLLRVTYDVFVLPFTSPSYYLTGA